MYIKILLCSILTGMMLMLGCADPTSPRASAQIIKFNPDTLKMPSTTGELTNANEVEITIRKFDEIPLNITGYKIDYIGQDGQIINEPELSHSAGYTMYLAPTEGGITGENGENVYDYTLKLPVYTTKLLAYLVGDGTDSSRVIVPITAQYTLFAADSNMHEHTFSCYIPINIPY